MRNFSRRGDFFLVTILDRAGLGKTGPCRGLLSSGTPMDSYLREYMERMDRLGANLYRRFISSHETYLIESNSPLKWREELYK
jgi:hypothetical protein